MESKKNYEFKGDLIIETSKIIREEYNKIADKLNQGSLELFPTIIAVYYLSRDSNEIVNHILTTEQHESIRKFVGI